MDGNLAIPPQSPYPRAHRSCQGPLRVRRQAMVPQHFGHRLLARGRGENTRPPLRVVLRAHFFFSLHSAVLILPRLVLPKEQAADFTSRHLRCYHSPTASSRRSHILLILPTETKSG